MDTSYGKLPEFSSVSISLYRMMLKLYVYRPTLEVASVKLPDMHS